MSVGLVVEIIGDSSKLAKELDKSKGDVGGFAGGLGGMAVKVAAVAGVAAIAATAIASMTQAAAEDAAEQARLTAAIEAAGAATANSTAEVEAAIAAGQEKAFTDSQSREALMSLVTATGSVTEATALLASAQDIARFANVDLAVAADAVAKAQAGQDGALRKLMPGLEKGATAADTLAAATAGAAGQADIYASSAKGMQERGADAFGELGEQVGEVFIPIIEELVPALIPVLQAFGQLVKSLLPAIIPLIRVVATVLGIVARALATVVGWLVKLVNWVGEAIGKLGAFLDSINPLKGISLPSLPFLSSSAGGPAASSLRAGFGAAPMAVSGAAPVINVYTTGDSLEAEQAVVRALRRQTRLNGGVIPALGWSGAIG